MTNARGRHRYHLRFVTSLHDELTGDALARLPDGWRQVRHAEVMEEKSDVDDGDQWEVGDVWVHWNLEVDAVMEGPSDRWEADRAFRDLAEDITGYRPGPGTSWSLRSALPS